MEIWYMDGAGNRFMAVDLRGREMDAGKLAVMLCKLRQADGLLALDHAEGADFGLRYRNRDGSKAELCGNGSRCACRFAWEKGLCGAEMTMLTDAGPLRGRRLGEELYSIRLSPPEAERNDLAPGWAYLELGSPGVPHAIRQYRGDLWQDREALLPRMRQTRFSPAFPKGANVSFYTPLGPNAIRLLTYERGVEDFTPSCGSASICAAWLLKKEGRLRVHSPGGTLTVTTARDAVTLEGPTKVLEVLQWE